MQNARIVLITGASSGIGKACADHLHSQGYTIIGASRRTTPAAPYRCIALDVTDDAQVEQVVSSVAREAGPIDAVVNCAGAGIAGSVEETPLRDAQEQLNLNFFGASAFTPCPAMRTPGAS